MTRVEQFIRMSNEKDELEWDAFAEEDDDQRDLMEDQIFELESRLNWLWDELTQEEREQVEELL